MGASIARLYWGAALCGLLNPTKLKKMALNSDCSLKDQDWEFVKKLTRVAHVNVLSKQVSLIFKSSNFDLGTNINNKLQFPKNWSLQYVGIYPSKHEDKHAVTMTFEILDL